MNFAELRTAFYDFVDDEVKDLYKTDKAARLINNALKMMGRKLEVIDEKVFIKCVTYAVVKSQTDLVFTLPTDFKRVRTAERLFINNNEDPLSVNWIDFPKRNDSDRFPRRARRNLTNTRPLCYLLGNKLGVVTPGDAYTLRLWYSHAIPKLLDEGDIPEGIPEDHHETIALQAAKLAYEIESRQFPFQQEYDEGVRDLMTTVQPRQAQKARYVRMTEDGY